MDHDRCQCNRCRTNRQRYNKDRYRNKRCNKCNDDKCHHDRDRNKRYNKCYDDKYHDDRDRNKRYNKCHNDKDYRPHDHICDQCHTDSNTTQKTICDSVIFHGCEVRKKVIFDCKLICPKVFSETGAITYKTDNSFYLTTSVKFKTPINFENFKLDPLDYNNINSDTRPSITYTEDILVMVYNDENDQLLFTKSLDHGITWKAPEQIGNDIYGSPSISYYDGVLGISYITLNGRFLRFIKSIDCGETWSSDKIKKDYKTKYSPSLVCCDNGFAIAYHSDDFNNEDAVFFTKSINRGNTWSTSINVHGNNQSDIIDYSPSLACCGDTFAIAYQGATGTLEVVLSNNAGTSWNTFDTTEEILLSPSLICCKDRFAISYQGTDQKLYFIESTRLNYMFSSPIIVNGSGIVNGIPSLVCCDDTYSIAYRDGNNLLSLVTRKDSWIDPIQIGDSMSSSPSLTFCKNRLTIAYPSDSQEMFFVSSTSQCIDWIAVGKVDC
jgi:hypothetical protein